MREDLSFPERINIVREMIRLTEAEGLRWEPTGADPRSFTSRRGGALATIERIEAPKYLRLRFQTVDGAMGDVVVIEFPVTESAGPGELKGLRSSLENLWRLTEKGAVPNAADLFLRGDT